MKNCLIISLGAFFLCSATSISRAEWTTESFALKAGWNAIYPLIDATHSTLDADLAGYPAIEEVWRWQPERVDPIQPGNPATPPTGLEWSVWRAGQPAESSFDKLAGNHGYLVKVADGTANFTLSIKGRPVLPEVRWRGDGIHLAGFPVISTGTTPTFSNYLAPTGFALGQAEILRYNGGPIASGSNPLVVNPTVGRITRGQAYWIRVEKFSRFYGPLSAQLDYGEEVRFGQRSDTARMVLKNETNATLTFTLDSVQSESAPAGQPAISGKLPLLVQVDAETEFTPLTTRTIELAAGKVVQVRLLPDRASMAGVVGARFAALMQLKTTAGVAGQQMFIPATAEIGSPAGLWVGEAQITQVGSILRRFARDSAGNPVRDPDGRPILIEDLTTPGGATDLPAVSRPYSLRLIVHVNAQGQARLLSHVYQGRLRDAPPEDSLGLTVDEDRLDPAFLGEAARLSVAHLPQDTRALLAGTFATAGTLNTAGDVTTAHASNLNPFLHIYHPDHDNLDAQFSNVLGDRRESFTIGRSIEFRFDASKPEGAGHTWGATLMTGTYLENISGPTKPNTSLRVRGPFELHKVSEIPAISGL